MVKISRGLIVVGAVEVKTTESWAQQDETLSPFAALSFPDSKKSIHLMLGGQRELDDSET